MPYPDYSIFVAFLDANPTRYKNTPEADGYNTTQDILNEITLREMMPNPEPQGEVPKPLSNADLQALLSEDSSGRLSDTWWYSMQTNLNSSINLDTGVVGSREDAVAQVDTSVDRNNITEAEGTALKNEINSTIPDPSWQSEVQDDADCKKEWDLGGMATSYVNDALGR